MSRTMSCTCTWKSVRGPNSVRARTGVCAHCMHAQIRGCCHLKQRELGTSVCPRSRGVHGRVGIWLLFGGGFDARVATNVERELRLRGKMRGVDGALASVERRLRGAWRNPVPLMYLCVRVRRAVV